MAENGNGNVKRSTVAIVIVALVLFGGVMMSLFGIHTNLTGENRILSERVTRLEEQSKNIDKKLDRVIRAVERGTR